MADNLPDDKEKDPAILAQIRERLKQMSDENRPPKEPDLAINLTHPDMNADKQTAKGVFMTKRFADGGAVDKDEETFLKTGLSPEPAPTESENEEHFLKTGLSLPSHKGPSDEEKHATVMNAIKSKTLKLNDGGAVDASGLPSDAPQDSKLQAIMKAIGMAGSNLANSPAGKVAGTFVDPMGALTDVAKSPAAQNIVKSEAETAVPAIRALGGIPASPTAPPAQSPIDQGFVDKLNAGTAMTPAPAAQPTTAHQPATPTPDPLAQLGKFDPSIVAPGFNPSDRQTLANSLDKNQHTFGNYLAQAIAGLGDAVAAKGGVRQNALGDIFNLQTQQRHEALENFDKARQIAVDHFTMKNQADQQLINNLKARNELIVSPEVAHMIGHPELAGKPTAHAELVIKTDAMKYDYANKMTERKQSSLKNAADEIDRAVAHGGILGTQKMMDPQSRLKMIHAQAIKNDPEAFGYHVTQGK